MHAKQKRVKLTDRFVKSATTGGRKSPIFMDDEVIGFGVQIRETGRKSFTLDYMFNRRRRSLCVGDFPDWSTSLGTKFVSLGNHEFGIPVAEFIKRIEQSNFQWLCTNFRFFANEIEASARFAQSLAKSKTRIVAWIDYNRIVSIRILGTWADVPTPR
jgi:hypothetical protein